MRINSVPGTRQILLAALTRRYPLYSGGIRFANHALVRRLGGTSDELVWARVKGGEVLAGLNDLVGRTAFYTGDLDRKISWVCGRIARPGDTVLDIGANIGIVTSVVIQTRWQNGESSCLRAQP